MKLLKTSKTYIHMTKITYYFMEYIQDIKGQS